MHAMCKADKLGNIDDEGELLRIASWCEQRRRAMLQRAQQNTASLDDARASDLIVRVPGDNPRERRDLVCQKTTWRRLWGLQQLGQVLFLLACVLVATEEIQTREVQVTGEA